MTQNINIERKMYVDEDHIQSDFISKIWSGIVSFICIHSRDLYIHIQCGNTKEIIKYRFLVTSEKKEDTIGKGCTKVFRGKCNILNTINLRFGYR